MTWTVNLNGHDDLEPEAKKVFEEGLVESIRMVVDSLRTTEGVNVTSARVTTNTTGSVNLFDNVPEPESPAEDSPESSLET